jgi:hypothetical protein
MQPPAGCQPWQPLLLQEQLLSMEVCCCCHVLPRGRVCREELSEYLNVNGFHLLSLQITLFDIQQRSTIAELATPPVKYVVWSADSKLVALLSKHAIIIADDKLRNAQTVGGGNKSPHQLSWCLTVARLFTHYEILLSIMHCACASCLLCPGS